MRLYLVRHAEAARGEPDELRPLTPRGREQARALGRGLVEAGARPAFVLSSPLLRARETAEVIARATGAASEPDERLAPGATAAGLEEAIAGRGGEVVVVCHQPDCGQIAAALLGGVEPPFPTAGLCVIDLDV